MQKRLQLAALSTFLFVDFSQTILGQEIGSPISGATESHPAVPSISVENKNWVQRAKRVLEIGEMGLKTAELKKELVQLIPSPDDDPRYVFAFVLVAMKEKQWASAQKNTKEILKRHKDYTPARVANARILLNQDQKLDSISDLELLAKGLDVHSFHVSPDQLAFAARFLGLAVGYLEGPGKESIKATALQALISEVGKISQSNQEPFSEARLAVGNEYQTFVEKGEKALSDLRNLQQTKIEVAMDKRKELEAQKAKSEADAAAARRQLESKWADATASWNVVWSNCQNLTLRSNNLVTQRGLLTSSIASLRQPQVDKEGKIDRNDEKRYEDAKRHYGSQIATIDGQLIALSSQHDIENRKGMAIENQMNVIRAEAQRLGMTLAAMNGSFASADKIARKKEEAAKKVQPKLSSSKLRQARAFSTYDDFNFHKEQTLLINTFPKD